MSPTLKRGFMRPTHSGRTPIFILAVIILLSVLLMYNLYSSSSVRSDLENEIVALGQKSSTCQDNTLALQGQLEELQKSCKLESADGKKNLEILQANNKETSYKVEYLTSHVDQLSKEIKNVNLELKTAHAHLAQSKANYTNLEDQVQKQQLKIQEQKAENDILIANKTSLLSIIHELQGRHSLSQKPPSNNDTKNLHSGDHMFTNNETSNQTGDWFLSNKILQEKLHLEQEDEIKRLEIANGSLITTLSPRFLVQSPITESKNAEEDIDFMNEAISMNNQGAKAAKNTMLHSGASFSRHASQFQRIPEQKLPEKVHNIHNLPKNGHFPTNSDKNDDLSNPVKENAKNSAKNDNLPKFDTNLDSFNIFDEKMQNSPNKHKKGKKARDKNFRSGEILDDQLENNGDAKTVKLVDTNELEVNIPKPDLSFNFKQDPKIAQEDEQYDGDQF